MYPSIYVLLLRFEEKEKKRKETQIPFHPKKNELVVINDEEDDINKSSTAWQ